MLMSMNGAGVTDDICSSTLQTKNCAASDKKRAGNLSPQTDEE